MRWLTGILLVLFGASLGHATTKEAMYSQTQRQINVMQANYVPRIELDTRLDTIVGHLERIEDKLDGGK